MIRRFLYRRHRRALGLFFRAVAILLPLGATPTVLSFQDPPSTDQPWIGNAAPPIELPTLSGEKESLTSFAGQKLVVLHFAASW